MPTYDFRCTDCGYEFAIFQLMNDERPPTARNVTAICAES